MGQRPFTRTLYTTPGHIPAHLPPFETLRANKVRRIGWVCSSFCCRGPDPLRGAGLPDPPLGGGQGGYLRCEALGRCTPGPLWGAGLPRPPVGGWGDVRRCA